MVIEAIINISPALAHGTSLSYLPFFDWFPHLGTFVHILRNWPLGTLSGLFLRAEHFLWAASTRLSLGSFPSFCGFHTGLETAVWKLLTTSF